jgi:hypothetical protein
MEISHKSGKELRSKIGTIATAIAFAFVICSVAVGTVRAADDHGHGDRGGDQHHDNGDRGRRGPAVRYVPQPDYYYAPPTPNYYYAPEPDYYYAPQPDYDTPPPQGIQLFFGL